MGMFQPGDVVTVVGPGANYPTAEVLELAAASAPRGTVVREHPERVDVGGQPSAEPEYEVTTANGASIEPERHLVLVERPAPKASRTK